MTVAVKERSEEQIVEAAQNDCLTVTLTGDCRLETVWTCYVANRPIPCVNQGSAFFVRLFKANWHSVAPNVKSGKKVCSPYTKTISGIVILVTNDRSQQEIRDP